MLTIASAWAVPSLAQAPIELRYLCYADGDECNVAESILDRFHQTNTDIRVIVDKVPFNVVREQLETRLNAGQGPDMARVTTLGSLNRHYLDLTPYIDAADWDRAFGPTLDWLRAGARDRGVYGFLTQLTVSGPFVNKSLFARAAVPIPGPGATWDDWAAAVAEVKRRTGAYSGIAFDRSGHRFAGPAISYGARLVGDDGQLLPPDAGVRAFADRLIRWHREELMPRDIWPSATGSRLRSGAEMFINGDAVMHMAGSWQVQRYADEIGDRFEWIVVPPPCGPSTCTAMPGGAAMVAFRRTQHPAAVARVMSYMASAQAVRQFAERTFNIPARRDLSTEDLDFSSAASVSPAAVNALKAFAEVAKMIDVQANRIQAHPRNNILFNAYAEFITQAIIGNRSLDDALTQIAQAVARAPR
jgi:alpha-1,4-digalacturonate transport system substrate-binding protein